MRPIKIKISSSIYKLRVSGLFEFNTPTYFVRDPKLIKKLAVKDFDSFSDHKVLLNEDADPLFGRALFSLQGNKWRGEKSIFIRLTLRYNYLFLIIIRHESNTVACIHR
jgi:hypothetical protein